MEVAITILSNLLEDPCVLDDDELRMAISTVLIRLHTMVCAKKNKEPERPSSPCPCGCDT